MFQNLRQNSPIYIFHKGENPKMEIGYVTAVSQPKPKYTLPTTFTQQQEMVVDISVKVGDQIVNYTMLPATVDIADTFLGKDSIVITDNKNAMNSEIIAVKQKSEDIIKSIDYHKQIICSCDSILNDLNPEYAEKQQQQLEINELKTQMQDVSATLSSLTELIKELKEKK